MPRKIDRADRHGQYVARFRANGSYETKWHVVDGQVEHNGKPSFLTRCGKYLARTLGHGDRLDFTQGIGSGLVCLNCATAE